MTQIGEVVAAEIFQAMKEVVHRPPVPLTWTTPLMRAERLLREIGEDLEFKRVSAAREKLTAHILEIRGLMAFIDAGLVDPPRGPRP